MYDEDIYLDISSGLGVEKVLKKIEPLINKWATDIRFGDMPFEDRKQEIYIIALQGISNYDDSKGTKLSSFLHTHIKNKILSKIRSSNKKSNNANIYMSDSSGYVKEIPESHILAGCADSTDGDSSLFDIYVDSSSESSSSDLYIFKDELKSSLSKDEFELVEMLERGLSVKDISDELGENYWTVSKNIKKIRSSRVFKEYNK